MIVRAATAFAPATIGNVGPGFDVLGLAVAGPGDRVTATLADHGDVRITSISGDGGALPTDAARNTAGVAATFTRRLAGREDIGIDLAIEKGIPLESGLGSSAASAAAAAHAVNQLLGAPLRKDDLLGPCVEAEAVVAGRHADNIAPALLGGLTLVCQMTPRVRIQRLPVPSDLHVVVVTPKARVATTNARAVLPENIPLSARTRNSANIAMLVSACYSGDLGLLAMCIADDVVTTARLPLITGAAAAIDAGRDAGALGATISGAGPSLFAFCHSPVVAAATRDAMIDAFKAAGIDASGFVSPAEAPGSRTVQPAETKP